jgi:cell wall-associated NlpC family hydrolase
VFRRLNPIVLLGIITVLILSIGVLAGAQGTTGADALAVGEGQLGKPWAMSTDGPDAFSCAGLMRYILRTTGVDPDAPWTPEEYLGRYAPVDMGNLQPGDIVIYPNWATMYAGGGMLLNSNEVLGYVTHTAMSDAGTPLGAVRPYGGAAEPQPVSEAVEPVATEQPVLDPTMADPALVDQAAVDPMLAEQPVYDPAMVDPLLAEQPAYDPTMADPMATEPVAAEPMM